MTEAEHSGRLMQVAIDRCSYGVYALDTEARLVTVNEAFCRMLGYTREEALRLHLSDVDPITANGGWADLWRKLQENGTLTFESKHRKKDGGEVYVEVMWTHSQHEGRDYGCAFARDLQDRQSLLRIQEEWQQTFDTIPDPLCILDENYQIVRMNAAMAKRVGLNRGDALGTLCFQCVHGTDSPPDTCPNRLTLLDGQIHHQEVWIERLKGWFSVSTSPLGWSNGGPRHTLHVMHDLTDSRRAEETRRKLERHELETKHVESLGVLAAGIAHDFNNILSGILGFANLAMAETPAQSPVRGYLGRIEKGVQRATALCLQMLAYAGESNFDIRPIRLNALLEELKPSLQSSMPPAAKVHFEFDNELPPIEGDFSQLAQAVLHLAHNAAEALENQAGSVTIRTFSVHADHAYLAEIPLGQDLPEGRYAVIEVKDTGCGIPADTLPRIFEPFFTTKFIGRGLGLSAVLGVIRSHHGTLKIDSTPDKGTCVQLLLPALSNEEDILEAMGVPGLDYAVAPDGLGKSVLLVDDEEVLRMVGERVLRRLGCQVLTATNGQEALELFRKHHDRIDGVVMDVVMPKMDGVEAFRAMRAIDPSVPILLASGHSFRDLHAELTGEGLSGFIQKPYRTDTLRQALSRALPT